MQKALRRMYLSVLMFGLSLIAIGFTTYAWYGIASNSNFETFTINLKESQAEDSEYGIQLSLTGKKGSFSDSIDPIAIKRKLLENAGYNADALSDQGVDVEFNKLNLDQCTVSRRKQDPSETEYKYLTDFYSFKSSRPAKTNNYLWFDLFISLYRKDGEIETSDNYLDIYLRELSDEEGKIGIMDSDVYSTNVVSDLKYPISNPSDGRKILGNANNGIPLGYQVPRKVYVKTSTSTRLAVQKISTARIGHPEDLWTVNDLTIYRTGSEFPTYDALNDIHDFGGVLEKNYNMAYLYHIATGGFDFDFLENYVKYENVLNRGDVLYEDNGISNHIITKDDHCTTDRMARFRFYFWFEGWDSNCFDVINKHKVSINMAFTTKHPDVQ